jgi:hypothetical protein
MQSIILTAKEFKEISGVILNVSKYLHIQIDDQDNAHGESSKGFADGIFLGHYVGLYERIKARTSSK